MVRIKGKLISVKFVGSLLLITLERIKMLLPVWIVLKLMSKRIKCYIKCLNKLFNQDAKYSPELTLTKNNCKELIPTLIKSCKMPCFSNTKTFAMVNSLGHIIAYIAELMKQIIRTLEIRKIKLFKIRSIDLKRSCRYRMLLTSSRSILIKNMRMRKRRDFTGKY